jgi:D-amino peptidase
MRTALLVIDLEGVAGVDGLDALVAGAPSYPAACAALTRETAAAVHGLLESGFDRVRVSDSHRAGAMRLNVDPSALPEGTLVLWEEDAFSPALLEGAAAVACLGMHAAAGTRGFAAHTMDVHCGWSLGGRRLSETDLLLGLSAERELPAIFAAGDDVLGASLRGKVRYVQTKQARGVRACLSGDSAEVQRALAQAARAHPAGTRPLPRGPLRITFKSRWQAHVAEAAGATRLDARTVEVAGPDLRTRYEFARRVVSASSAPLTEAVRGMPGLPSFVEDAVALVARPLRPSRVPDASARADRALAAFLRRTDGAADCQVADRAITLHMLEGHAPRFFSRHALRAILQDALQRLARLPTAFPQGLDPFTGMARLDALYLLRLRGRPTRGVEAAELRDYLLHGGFASGRLWGWLMGELAGRAGLLPRAPPAPRVLRQSQRQDDLYWLTHLFLLETDYLARAPDAQVLLPEREELLLAAPSIVAGRQVDLAAEVALCLQSCGEQGAAEHRALLSLIGRHQARDGTVRDPSRGAGDDPRAVAHCTAASLVALAGVAERSGSD